MKFLVDESVEYQVVIYLQKLPTWGVILFRLPQGTSVTKINFLQILFSKHITKLKHSFIVMTTDEIRIRQVIKKDLV